MSTKEQLQVRPRSSLPLSRRVAAQHGQCLDCLMTVMQPLCGSICFPCLAAALPGRFDHATGHLSAPPGMHCMQIITLTLFREAWTLSSILRVARLQGDLNAALADVPQLARLRSNMAANSQSPRHGPGASAGSAAVEGCGAEYSAPVATAQHSAAATVSAAAESRSMLTVHKRVFKGWPDKQWPQERQTTPRQSKHTQPATRQQAQWSNDQRHNRWQKHHPDATNPDMGVHAEREKLLDSRAAAIPAEAEASWHAASVVQGA